MVLERGFQEISVTRLGYQTATQRFGASRTAQTAQFPAPDESDSDDEQDVDSTYALPRIVVTRMNLTCLSQYQNLYFVAYGDKIYVYRPQNPQQALPREPDLILEPPQSQEAMRVTPSRYYGHIINHLVLGDLGDKEILVCTCHDGDVVAYYTQAIENALQIYPASSTINVKFFFAENVGNSAWGLAIHSQSRLIAVGSNSHEIQVFAFALSVSETQKPTSAMKARGRKHPTSPPGHMQFPIIQQADIPRASDGEVMRNQNFRLVFKLREVGDNIPSVTFSSSIRGDADTIIATDIKGALWFFRLWEDSLKRLPSIYEPLDSHGNPIGWGVIILPRDFFKPTYDQADTFGWPKSFSNLRLREGMIDISKTVQDVRDSTIWHDDYDTDDGEDEDEDDEDDEGSDDDRDDLESDRNTLSDPEFEMLLTQEDAIASLFGEEQHMIMNDPEAEYTDTLLADQSFLIPEPSIISSQSMPMSIDQISAIKKAEPNGAKNDFRLSKSGELILQCYRHHITLHPTDDNWVPTQCDNLLRQEFLHDVSFPRPLTDYDRLNMLATIPELSLVLVASQVGRVALITITRPVIKGNIDQYSRLGNIVAMRIDLILPFRHEEIEERIRPSHGLLGMAVGPMQSERAKMAATETRQRPRRWRLMLHYFDHTILSYELSRDEENRELLVL